MLKKGIVVVHFLLTIVAWTSWIWLSWKYISLLSLMHIIMLEIGDGCFLSHYQFKDKITKNTTFYEWWLGKLGIKRYNRKKLKIFMRYCLPLLLSLLGILFQDIFHFITPII